MATQIERPDEFIRAVELSGVVSDEKLRESLAKVSGGGEPSSASTVADSMVADKALTRWQADYILQGKYKNFFLGKYCLLSLIGKGGMGAVYLAEHTMLNRRCAIKVLPGVFAKNKSYIERFMREAQAVAAMDHPNIVRAYDVDKDVNDKREMYYLTMEYVEGKDVDEVVKESVAKKGPIKGLPDFVTAADIIRQAAEGLEYAHNRSLVHRDIKPANLLLNKDGVVKILDLGLARNFDDDEAASLTAAQNATYLGTPDYLAPEQAIDCHDVDGRADIYSLGCTLYFLLTGNPPFKEGTIAQRLIAHQTKAPPSIKKIRPDAPQELIDITELMMEKDREDRYQTAKEIANALSGWLMENAGDEWIEKNPAAVSTADSGMGAVDDLEEIDEPDDAFDDIASLAAASMQSGIGGSLSSPSGIGVPGGSGVAQRSGIGQHSGIGQPLAPGSGIGRSGPQAVRRPGQQAAKKIAFPMWAIISSIAGGVLLLIGVIVLVVVLASSGGDDDDSSSVAGDPNAGKTPEVDPKSPSAAPPKTNDQKNKNDERSDAEKEAEQQQKQNSSQQQKGKNGGKKNGENQPDSKQNDDQKNGDGKVEPIVPKPFALAEIPFARFDEGDIAFSAKWLVPVGAFTIQKDAGIDKSNGLEIVSGSDHSMSELRREFVVPSGGTLVYASDFQLTTDKNGLPQKTASPFAMYIGTSGLGGENRTEVSLARSSNGTFELRAELPRTQRITVKPEQLGIGNNNQGSTEWLRMEMRLTRLSEQNAIQGSVTLFSLGKDGKQPPQEIVKQVSEPGTDRQNLWQASSWAIGFSSAEIDAAKVDKVAVDNFAIRVLNP